jgi:hypothetical protein
MIEVWKYVNPAVKSYGLLPITAKVAFVMEVFCSLAMEKN